MCSCSSLHWLYKGTHIFTVFICLFFFSLVLSVFLSLTRPPFLPLSPLSKLLISEAPPWITEFVNVCVCLHSALKTVCTTDTDTLTQSHMIVSCYYVGSMLLFPRLFLSRLSHTHTVSVSSGTYQTHLIHFSLVLQKWLQQIITVSRIYLHVHLFKNHP